MEMTTSTCEDLRRELAAASGEGGVLSPTARAHLAACEACAIAVADAVLASVPPAAPSPAAPPPPALADLAAPLAAADASHLGWLFAGARPGPRVLGLAVAVAFAVALFATAFDAPCRSYDAMEQTTWSGAFEDLARGLTAIEKVPGAVERLKSLDHRPTDDESDPRLALDWPRSGPPTGRSVERYLRNVRLNDHKLTSAGLRQLARLLPDGPDRPAAARFMLNVVHAMPALEDLEDARDVVRLLYEEGSRERTGDAQELAWIGIAFQFDLVPRDRRGALCERALQLRWNLLRKFGRTARSSLQFSDRHCDIHDGHATPRLAGGRTEIAGSLAAGRLLHAWHAGWPAVARALCDRDWLAANVIWSFRSTIPGLAGCVVFLALWLLAIALRRRGVLSGALALEPDRGARQLRAAALLAAPSLTGLAMCAGVGWVCVQFAASLAASDQVGPEDLLMPLGQVLAYLYDSEIDAVPHYRSMLLAFAVWTVVAGGLIALLVRALTWLEPGRSLTWSTVLVPLAATGAFALAPRDWHSAWSQPLLLGCAMLLALRWLRTHGSPGERRLAALTATCAALLLFTNTGVLGHIVEPSGLVLRAGVAALVLLFLPAATGYLLAHLPPGTVRSQRLLAIGAVAFGPALFASLAVRVALAGALETPDRIPPAAVALTALAMVVTAVLALVLGARLAPAGAAAYRDPEPPRGRIGRFFAVLERSRLALAAWLACGWALGHVGLLAMRVNLF